MAADFLVLYGNHLPLLVFGGHFATSFVVLPLFSVVVFGRQPQTVIVLRHVRVLVKNRDPDLTVVLLAADLAQLLAGLARSRDLTAMAFLLFLCAGGCGSEIEAAKFEV